MANSQLNGPRYSYVSIDEAPGADGDWCKPVSMTGEQAEELFASVSGGGVATVYLQYLLKHTGAAWVDYTTAETLESGARFRLDDHGAGVKWRMGVKEDTSADPSYTEGTIIAGFDW